MKQSKNIIVILCLVLFLPLSGFAAEQKATALDKQKAKMEQILKDATFNKDKKIDSVPKIANGVDDPMRPKPLPSGSTDPETKRLLEKALQDYYAYRSQGLEHRKAVFRWQLFSAKLIFILVLGLVICGIVFAGIQFRVGLLQSSSGSNKAEDLETQIELKSDGVKISSPVLGVIILFLSLGFFYLYLVYVYPIENIF